MHFYSLSSGSNANSVLVVSEGRLLLIDVGLTLTETKARIASLGFQLDDVAAILITHEHIDHVRSAPFVDATKLYATKGTWPIDRQHELVPFQSYLIAGFEITPLPISHDATNGVGYVIDDGEERLVYMTDTGYVHQKCLPYMKNAEHYMFESNHDVKMLLESNRPEILKRRILSNEGHLSNVDSALILCELIGPKTKSIVLAHLSEVANKPDLAVQVLREIAAEKQVDIRRIHIQAASREKVTVGS